MKRTALLTETGIQPLLYRGMRRYQPYFCAHSVKRMNWSFCGSWRTLPIIGRRGGPGATCRLRKVIRITYAPANIRASRQMECMAPLAITVSLPGPTACSKETDMCEDICCKDYEGTEGTSNRKKSEFAVCTGATGLTSSLLHLIES